MCHFCLLRSVYHVHLVDTSIYTSGTLIVYNLDMVEEAKQTENEMKKQRMTTKQRIDIATKAISKMTANEVIASMSDRQWKRFEAAPEWMSARWFVISEIVVASS